MTDIKEYLDAERFRQWLKTLHPIGSAGKAHRLYECPLACYLSSQTGERAGVGEYIAFTIPEPSSVFLPRWAVRFVKKINAVMDEGEVVTAAEAIAVLEEAMREELEE